jgi:hypothetical protein
MELDTLLLLSSTRTVMQSPEPYPLYPKLDNNCVSWRGLEGSSA